MQLVVARHVALDLSAFDVMTLAHNRQAVKHSFAWAVWAVNFSSPTCAWHAGAGLDAAAKLDARDGQYGQSGQPIFNRYLATASPS